jgi:hypothetical protein
MSTEPEATAETTAAVRVVDRPIVVLPVFALVASVGGLFDSFTLGANVMVFAIGGTMVWVGLAGGLARRPAPRTLARSALWWLVPVLLLGLTELIADLHLPRSAYPTISSIFDPILDHYLPRALGYLAWLGGYWTLARR